MPDYRKKLQDLLVELFQFDAADLDFGIYAVMNHKRDQVACFRDDYGGEESNDSPRLWREFAP